MKYSIVYYNIYIILDNILISFSVDVEVVVPGVPVDVVDSGDVLQEIT